LQIAISERPDYSLILLIDNQIFISASRPSQPEFAYLDSYLGGYFIPGTGKCLIFSQTNKL